MSLSRDQILALDDLKSDEVEVPEWQGVVKIRELSGKQRNDLSKMFLDSKVDGETRVPENFMAKVVSWAAINGTGERMFSDEDIEALANKNGKAIERIYKRVMDLSGVNEDAVEEAEKNS